MSHSSALEITIIPLLEDNYSYLLRDKTTNKTAIVDPSEAPKVLDLLKSKKLKLDFVLNTHHHWDHTGGNLALKDATGCKIVGPAYDKARIPGIDISLDESTEFKLGESPAKIIHTPGHTRGQINYWFYQNHALFTGDTLFSLGCGRNFEGDAQQFWSSLDKIRKLPGDTQVYCGHEYTLSNAKFAMSVDSQNKALQIRRDTAELCRVKNAPTIPVKLSEELETNPFLRPDSAAIRASLHLEDAQDFEVFGALRQRKDQFR